MGKMPAEQRPTAAERDGSNEGELGAGPERGPWGRVAHVLKAPWRRAGLLSPRSEFTVRRTWWCWVWGDNQR